MRCPHCPRPSGSPCSGETVPRLCELVDPQSVDYRPMYMKLLDPDASGIDAARVLPPLPATLTALRLARACPEAGTPACSCEGARSCRRFGRDVALQDCLACLGELEPAR